MSRFFKFKSAEDVSRLAMEMGHRIPVSDDFSQLFEPVQIGAFRVGNRFCIQPMEGCDGTTDGSPGELTFRRFRRFGAGGAKLIWGEATAISDEGRMNPRQLWIHDKSASGIETALRECRDAHRDAFGTDSDLMIGLQLTHAGRYSFQSPRIVMHDPLLDPLTVDSSTGRTIDSTYPLLSDSDLQQIEDHYVAAARLAWMIGCNFVDLKQCHRYLLSELLASRNRPGDYGGSLDNRTRLIRNIVCRIRAEFPSLVILSRLNVFDGIPFEKGSDAIGKPVIPAFPVDSGFGVDPDNPHHVDLREPLQVATWLAEWGVAALNVSLGNPYACPHLLRPAEFPPIDGYEAPEHPLLSVIRHFDLTDEIQRAVPSVPVIGSGYSWLQEFAIHAAAGNVREGRCMIVGLGRAALSQPDFVRQLMYHGHLTRKKICRTFSYCTNLMRSKDDPLNQTPTGCPPFDREVYGPIWKDASERHKKS